MIICTRQKLGDRSLEDIIIGTRPCGGVRKEKRKEKVLALGPILSTRTPVRGARM